MQTRIPLALALSGAVVLSLLTGCADHRSKWLGTWKGETEGVGQTEDPVVANTLRQVELVVNPDATYSLRWGPLPVTGNIHFGKEKSTLRPLQVMDQPLQAQPQEVQNLHQGVELHYLSPTELKLIDTKNNRPEVILKRQEN